MKRFSAAFTAHLASGATTLAWCWRITRGDGLRLGFTDHDRDLAFDGTTFEAAAGFTAGKIEDRVGLSVDNLEVEAALSSDVLRDEDLADGLYDAAVVEIWRVNWADPSQRALMRKGALGEVRRSGLIFTGEIRGLSHLLGQPQVRLFQYTCDARFGDRRCGVDVAAPPNRVAGTIAPSSTARRLLIEGVAAHASGNFTRGLAKFVSGEFVGRAFEIRRHARDGLMAEIELWQPLPAPPRPGDGVTLIVGCDKTFATCRDRFANAAAFRGFPHMPGNDFVTAIARPGDPANDGTARVS